MNRISKDEYYLGIAKAVTKRSTCLKRRYGCVIVKNDFTKTHDFSKANYFIDNLEQLETILN